MATLVFATLGDFAMDSQSPLLRGMAAFALAHVRCPLRTVEGPDSPQSALSRAPTGDD